MSMSEFSMGIGSKSVTVLPVQSAKAPSIEIVAGAMPAYALTLALAKWTIENEDVTPSSSMVADTNCPGVRAEESTAKSMVCSSPGLIENCDIPLEPVTPTNSGDTESTVPPSPSQLKVRLISCALSDIVKTPSDARSCEGATSFTSKLPLYVIG